jgi:hypothetical protein
MGNQHGLTPAEGMTALELLALMSPQQRAEYDAQVASRRIGAQKPDPEQAPILADLRAIGVDVHSVWSQFLQPDEDPRIYEILLRHLQSGGYDIRTMEGMATKFERPSGRKYWSQLRELYLASPPGTTYRDALAASLGVSGRKQQLDGLIELVGRKELGESRILLMHKIKRVGGERGLALIESLRDDPELGIEAKVLLKQKPRRPN